MDRKQGCLSLVAAFTLFFWLLKALGYIDIGWFWLLWPIWVPALIILLILVVM